MREKAGDAKRGNPYGWNSPRGARAVNRSRYLMRALGLEVLSCSVQSLLGSHSEERKVVIEQSRWVAICRSAVHMLPVAASITLFYFNIHGYYIGGSLSGTLAISDSVKLNMLQFAAKIHELLIVASLAEVVFYLMRNQLIFGQGLPLGLLGSGLNFMSPRFFWSPEFWGAMGYKAAPWTKFWIFSAFTVAGIVAGLAGPSSAILMIPRNQTWSTATWEYYLTGTTNDLWPAVLQQQHTGGSDCNSPNATDNAFCVSGGYSALFHHFSVFTQMPQSNAFTIDVEDKATKQTLKGNIRNNWQPDSETWTQAPHAATTVLEEPLREVWSFNLRYTSGNLVYSSIRTVRSETRFPVVRTVCVPLQNISASVSSLPFPVLPEYDFWHVPSVASGYYGNGPVASLELSQSAGQIWNSSASRVPLSARAKWISLPAEFGSITSGLIIAIPPEPGQSNALAITCSVDSRWAKGESWLTSSQEDWAWAGFYGPMQSNPLRTRSGYNDYGGARLFLPIDDGSWSRIAADEAWLDALTPQLSTSSGTASTTLESTLANSIPNVVNINSIDDVFSNTSSILIPFVEHVISTTMADGISRVGSALQMNTSNLIKKLTSVPTAQIRLSRKPLDPPSGPFTKMQMRTEVQGYSYSTSGFTVWLALTVLFLHCLIAAGYTLLVVGWTGKTSSCWDSVSELLALVQNSPPAPCVLRNTSAGIKELSTFAHTAKLVVAKDQDNVELVYLSDGHLNDSGLGGVVPGKAYGHSP